MLFSDVGSGTLVDAINRGSSAESDDGIAGRFIETTVGGLGGIPFSTPNGGSDVDLCGQGNTLAYWTCVGKTVQRP